MEVGFKKNKPTEEKESRFLKVELSNYTSPIFAESNRKDYVTWGKWNEYPYFLITLLNSHSEHGSIVKGKASYVYGKGLEYTGDNVLKVAKGLNFLDNANRYETWNEVYKKTCIQFQLYNGFAWQIIWKNNKTSFEVYSMELGNLRRLKCGKKVAYCKEWLIEQGGKYVPNNNPETSNSYKEFNLFNPNIRTGTQILWFKVDEPNVVPFGDFYPRPEYDSCIMEIETDIEISKLHYWHMKNGMFASSLLSFFNGEPDAKEKKAIKQMFQRTYGGTDNSGSVLFSFNDKGGTAPDIKTLTQSDLDKQFELVSKRNQDKIFATHRVAPVLFGIKTEGSLSDTSGAATVKEWEKFVKTYIESRQETILNEIVNLAFVQGVDLDGLEVIQTSPVGLDLPLDDNILSLFDDETKRKYFAKKYGIEIAETSTGSVTTPSVVTPNIQVNEHLKKLSGREWQQIKRMIREVKNGKTSKQVASLMLKNGYALTDLDIETLLSDQTNFNAFSIQKSEEDAVFALFEKFAIDDNDDETAYEFTSHKFLTDKEIQDSLIDVYTGAPQTTPEQAAKLLGVDVETITKILAILIANELLTQAAVGYQPTEKAIKRKVEPVETETYTVYAYVTRADVPEAESTRNFCKKMLALTRQGKRWTREAIENITATAKQLMSMPDDWDAWSYRGGFYTNPDTGEVTAFCRHIFRGIVKTRKKGGKSGNN